MPQPNRIFNLQWCKCIIYEYCITNISAKCFHKCANTKTYSENPAKDCAYIAYLTSQYMM